MALSLVSRNLLAQQRRNLLPQSHLQKALFNDATFPGKVPWSQPPAFASVPEEKIVELSNESIHQLTLSDLVKYLSLSVLTSNRLLTSVFQSWPTTALNQRLVSLCELHFEPYTNPTCSSGACPSKSSLHCGLKSQHLAYLRQLPALTADIDSLL